MQLPAQSATMSVEVSPPHTKNENYYTYKWEQQKTPAGVSIDVLCLIIFVLSYLFSHPLSGLRVSLDLTDKNEILITRLYFPTNLNHNKFVYSGQFSSRRFDEVTCYN